MALVTVGHQARLNASNHPDVEAWGPLGGTKIHKKNMLEAMLKKGPVVGIGDLLGIRLPSYMVIIS